MLRLGVTGGIGSGKTIVCSIFEQFGVPVYNADARAKWLVNHTEALKESIITHFGSEAFKDHTYNSKYIGNIVFHDASKLSELNAIIHPFVFQDWNLFCEQHQQHPIVIKEAAIMFETESRTTVDKILLVHAPEQLRINRVMARDGISEDLIKAKIKSQMPEDEKLKLADYIIYNDESHSLIEQINKLYHQLLSLS